MHLWEWWTLLDMCICWWVGGGYADEEVGQEECPADKYCGRLMSCMPAKHTAGTITQVSRQR